MAENVVSEPLESDPNTKKSFDEASPVGAPREDTDADDFHSADEGTEKEETGVKTEARDEKKKSSEEEEKSGKISHDEKAGEKNEAERKEEKNEDDDDNTNESEEEEVEVESLSDVSADEEEEDDDDEDEDEDEEDEGDDENGASEQERKEEEEDDENEEEEEEAETVEQERKERLRDPSYAPRRISFFLHDTRFYDETEMKRNIDPELDHSRRRRKWNVEDEDEVQRPGIDADRWGHDLYKEEEQGPKEVYERQTDDDGEERRYSRGGRGGRRGSRGRRGFRGQTGRHPRSRGGRGGGGDRFHNDNDREYDQSRQRDDKESGWRGRGGGTYRGGRGRNEQLPYNEYRRRRQDEPDDDDNDDDGDRRQRTDRRRRADSEDDETGEVTFARRGRGGRSRGIVRSGGVMTVTPRRATAPAQASTGGANEEIEKAAERQAKSQPKPNPSRALHSRTPTFGSDESAQTQPPKGRGRGRGATSFGGGDDAEKPKRYSSQRAAATQKPGGEQIPAAAAATVPPPQPVAAVPQAAHPMNPPQALAPFPVSVETLTPEEQMVLYEFRHQAQLQHQQQHEAVARAKKAQAFASQYASVPHVIYPQGFSPSPDPDGSGVPGQFYGGAFYPSHQPPPGLQQGSGGVAGSGRPRSAVPIVSPENKRN